MNCLASPRKRPAYDLRLADAPSLLLRTSKGAQTAPHQWQSGDTFPRNGWVLAWRCTTAATVLHGGLKPLPVQAHPSRALMSDLTVARDADTLCKCHIVCMMETGIPIRQGASVG